MIRSVERSLTWYKEERARLIAENRALSHIAENARLQLDRIIGLFILCERKEYAGYEDEIMTVLTTELFGLQSATAEKRAEEFLRQLLLVNQARKSNIAKLIRVIDCEKPTVENGD